MRPVRVLALSPVPEEGAGCRFRVSKYIPYLESRGFCVRVSPFFTPRFFRVVYRRGKYLQKAAWFTVQTLRRLRLLARQNDHDLFFVYREAIPVGPPLIELALARIPGRPLVYDFDDAIFLPNISDANKLVCILKYSQKVFRIIQASTRVVAGIGNLAGYARSYNESAFIPLTQSWIPRPLRAASLLRG